MTERPVEPVSDDRVEADLADPGAKPQPAEGGRDEVADLPGADGPPPGDRPADEDVQGSNLTSRERISGEIRRDS